MKSRLRYVPPKQRLAQRSGRLIWPMSLPAALKTCTPSIPSSPIPHPHLRLPSTSTATCGADGGWEKRGWTACTSSTPRASSSARSTCPNAAPTSASAARIATGSSCRRAPRSIPSTSTRRARSEDERERLAAESAISGSVGPRRRSELREVQAEPREGRASLHRLSLGGRSGVARRHARAPLERHPEQPHHALGRGDGDYDRLSQAVELRQRQHAGPPGPPRHVPARRAQR